jgi:transcriptional regulator of acetoin/glycerol metabolism
MTPAEANNDFRARRGHQMELIERDLLERYLLEATGNVSAAARRANLPRRTFYRLMERYGIQRRQFSNRPRSGE